MSESFRTAKLRILQLGKFYKPYRGGMETVLSFLCEELKKDYEIEVLVANHNRTTQIEIVDGVPVTRVSSYGQRFSTSLCPQFPGELKKRKADIVHLHFPNPLAEVSYLLSRHKAPLVISYHSDVLRPKRLYNLYLPILRRLLRRADKIIVASPSLLSGSARLRDFQHKCAVIPYGIQLSDYEPLPAIRVRAERLKEEHGDRLVLFVGRLVYYKGVETLLEAMTKIEGRLLLIGNGPLAAPMRRKCAELKLESKVHFLGEVSQEELISAYHACRVFVLPSTDKVEAFGMVQLEAMACGKPVVSTRLPTGVPWVNQDGITGRVVPPRDSTALASAVNELLDNASLADQMGRRGRERVEKFFSKEVMALEYAKVYQALKKETAKDRWPRVSFFTRSCKRFFDIFLSGLGLVLAFPLACVFSLAIWLEDHGPIFYLQERVGKEGRLFKLIKFRSMIPAAEKDLPLQASENDSRVTRVGRLLRATAMDELPQLLNILKGDMSFVGPRALRSQEVERASVSEVPTDIRKVPGYPLRIKVRPGLTGIAQIFAPRDTLMRHKFRYDLLYIHRIGFWLDLKLIFVSFLITFRGEWEKRGHPGRGQAHA